MKNSNHSSGITFAGALALIFVVLRLIPTDHGHHVINWSWWWVLSPIWISWGLLLLIVVLIFVVALIKGIR